MDLSTRLSFEMARDYLMEKVPHARALGMRLTACAEGFASGEQPYDTRLIGNPDTGEIAGGVVTTLLDSICGMAVLSKLRVVQRIATVDLRVDYLRPTSPERTLHCIADCYRVTHHIAFVRATVHDGAESDPLATAVGTFMLLPNEIHPAAARELAQ
ncbi:MAG TPA: PaaI family thioesterase [Spongiibacteraceae bacterium]|nr:PaaI family thioesterase [Spongiibacteraceae bacterium]